MLSIGCCLTPPIELSLWSSPTPSWGSFWVHFFFLIDWLITTVSHLFFVSVTDMETLDGLLWWRRRGSHDHWVLLANLLARLLPADHLSLSQPCRNTMQPRRCSLKYQRTQWGRYTASGRGSGRPRRLLRTRMPSENTCVSEPIWSVTCLSISISNTGI